MRFSLSTTFSRLVLLAFIVVTLLVLSGGGVMAPTEGVPWIGWLYMHHPILIWVAGIPMLWQLLKAWRHHPDHPLLLSVSTISTVLFFIQAWIGPGDFLCSAGSQREWSKTEKYSRVIGFGVFGVNIST